MIDDASFLRTMMADPSDASHRRVYADWLEERDDPRAPFLRLNADDDEIHYVNWLRSANRDGNIDFYLERFPEIKRLADARLSCESVRKEAKALSGKLDPEWVAFMRTLARPFREFFFFNNTGSPNECEPDELPFQEPIGTRGAVITFATAFRNENAWDAGLASDLRFVRELELTECCYGAASCPMHPFICELESDHATLSGADALAALKPRQFRSDYMADLEAAEIPYPGYHPGRNDEIHTEFDGQYIFAKRHEDLGADALDGPIDPAHGAHGALKGYVSDEKLWYVLLHTTPDKQYQISRYAILLTVGRSPSGRRLVGVITHQVCHNLCD